MKSTQPITQIPMTQPRSRSSRWMVAFALLGGLLVFPGCASIVSGTNQHVKITSNPDAANVKVEQLSGANNIVQWEGKTPASIKLSRNGSYLVTLSSDGYRTEQIPVSSAGMNGWVWGNIVFGGIIGIVIDSADGAAKNLEPNAIDVRMVSLQSAQSGQNAVISTPGSDDTAAKSHAAGSPKQMNN